MAARRRSRGLPARLPALLLGMFAASPTGRTQPVPTDLASPNVVESRRAREPSAPPELLVYLAGHMRAFPLISEQMKALLDVIAGGGDDPPYAVYMHTWDELDHGDAVWWRGNRKPTDVPSYGRGAILAALRDPSLNAFLSGRRFVARVDSHPGSAALSAQYGTRELNAVCAHRIACIDHTAAQLHELRIVHALARQHLRLRGGPDAAPPGRTPVLKSRPDVLLSDGWKSHQSLARMRKALGAEQAGGGPGVGHEADDSAAARGARRARGRADGRAPPLRCLGHTGPWHGGWGDISWVLSLDGVDAVMARAPHLRELLADESSPEAARYHRYRELAAAKARRDYHAEQAWREVLIKSGVSSFITGWMAGLAKARVARHPNGTIGVEQWHCYRMKAWEEADAFFRQRGFSKHYPPVRLPSGS